MSTIVSHRACRTDIWRVLVLERYGGVYADSDDRCVKTYHRGIYRYRSSDTLLLHLPTTPYGRPLLPFREFIPPDADMVSAPRNASREEEEYVRFEFCFLAYSPRHIFLHETLSAIVDETLQTNAAGEWKGCHNVTGERACHGFFGDHT